MILRDWFWIIVIWAFTILAFTSYTIIDKCEPVVDTLYVTDTLWSNSMVFFCLGPDGWYRCPEKEVLNE